MIYSATKATLQRHLGFQNFVEEKHANTSSELTFDFFQGSLAAVYSLSPAEEIRNSIVFPLLCCFGVLAYAFWCGGGFIWQKNAEENERNERSKRPSSGIGGYHSVQLAFSPSASNLVQRFQCGSDNFVELVWFSLFSDISPCFLFPDLQFTSFIVSILCRESTTRKPESMAFHQEMSLSPLFQQRSQHRSLDITWWNTKWTMCSSMSAPPQPPVKCEWFIQQQNPLFYPISSLQVSKLANL